MVHQPISRKQRLLQELNNKPLPDQQKLSTNNFTVERQSTKPKVGLHTHIVYYMLSKLNY